MLGRGQQGQHHVARRRQGRRGRRGRQGRPGWRRQARRPRGLSGRAVAFRGPKALRRRPVPGCGAGVRRRGGALVPLRRGRRAAVRRQGELHAQLALMAAPVPRGRLPWEPAVAAAHPAA